MNTKRQTTVTKGNNKESTMKPTASKLIRWAGLAAMGAGIIFVVVQPIHPPEILSSVTTARWAIVHYLSVTMCLLGLFGMAGLYARQVEETGWLGLAGYLLLSLFYALTLVFVFAEAFILPLVATNAPKFIAGWLGIVGGPAGGMNLAAIAIIYKLTGFVGYVLGGLLFGIATFRAGILSRRAAGLLGVGAVLAPAFGLLLPEFQRIAAVPMGIALAWLGYALWSERREPAAAPVPVTGSPLLRPTAAE
jgi:hypothetical protein